MFWKKRPEKWVTLIDMVIVGECEHHTRTIRLMSYHSSETAANQASWFRTRPDLAKFIDEFNTADPGSMGAITFNDGTTSIVIERHRYVALFVTSEYHEL